MKKLVRLMLCKKNQEMGYFFWKKDFFSTLKGQAVNDDDYENLKKLFILLKMHNLSDLNDLYNAQNVILLLEILENRYWESDVEKKKKNYQISHLWHNKAFVNNGQILSFFCSD